jgi:hypothetical protein
MLGSSSSRRRPRPYQQGREASTTIFIKPSCADRSRVLVSLQNDTSTHAEVGGPRNIFAPQSRMRIVEEECAKVCSTWPSLFPPPIQERRRHPPASAAVSSPLLSRRLITATTFFNPYFLLLLPFLLLLLLDNDARSGGLGIVGVEAFNLPPQSAIRASAARPVLLYRSFRSSSIESLNFRRPPARFSVGPLFRLTAGGDGEGDGGDDLVRRNVPLPSLFCLVPLIPLLYVCFGFYNFL